MSSYICRWLLGSILIIIAVLSGARRTHAGSVSQLPEFCGAHDERRVSSDYKATPEDERFVKEVVTQMAKGAPQNMPWPPIVRVTSSPIFQACALTVSGSDGEKHSYVIVYTGLLRDVIQGKPDRLAFILGHEFGHIALGHTQKDYSAETPFVQNAFTRDQELAADQYGMNWALKVGFSYDESLRAFIVMRQGGDYSSFEALGVDHPSLSDRIAALDRNQAVLWRAMSAFSSGVYFLQTEQYALAENCFRSVTKQFPQSYEAWANLGYAQLMEYADALDQSDLRRFGIGQILVGGFYRRPSSLEAQVRGINEQLWWDAVGDLKESIRRKPDLAATYANLGIAYLIQPSGTNPGAAQKYLEQAYQLAAKDTSLDAMSRVTLIINLAVAAAAGRDYPRFDELIEQAVSALKVVPREEPGASTLRASQAIEYNRAVRLAASTQSSEQRQALTQIEGYLRSSSPDSAWWDLGYDLYSQVCTKLGVQPKTRESFTSTVTPRFRPAVSLHLSKGEVRLGELVREVQALLGRGEVSPAIPNTNLILIQFPTEGIELIANDTVLAIILTTPQHPVPVREEGLGTTPTDLRVGMQMSDIVKVLGSYDVNWLLDPNKPFWFYADVGLAILAAQDHVTQIVLVRAPRAKKI